MNQRPPSTSYQSLVRTITGFGQFRKRWSVLHGLAVAILLGPGTLLVWFFADWLFKLPPWPLLLAFVVVAGLALWGVVAYLGRALLRRFRLEREALVVEALHGKLDNRLIGSIQLGREASASEDPRADKPPVAQSVPLGYSADLVWALVDQTAQTVAREDVKRLVDLRPTRKRLAGALGVVISILLCVVLARAAVAERMDRLRDAYAAVLDSLFPVEMLVKPGDVAVVRGRPVVLAVEVRGARRREVRLVRTDLKTKQSQTMMLPLEAQRGMLEIAHAEESFSYRFEYSRRKSEQYKVSVGDLPEVSAINYELAYPAYTGQPTRTLSGRMPRVQGLAGTGVLVSFAATTDLDPNSCYVQWQDGSKQLIPITGRFGHFSFTIARPDRASIYLTGGYGKGFEMERPINFEIGMQADEPPTVKLVSRNRKLTLMAEEAQAFGLPWMAEDDFGVAEVNLDYKIDTVDELLGRGARQGSVPRRIEPSQDRVKGQFTEMFKSLAPPLQPGDRITITVSAKDNNTETGPSLGKSLPVEIVVVQPDLAKFIELQYGFGGQTLLGGLRRVQRATDLLIEAGKTVRTEKPQVVDKQDLKSRVNQENWPSGAEDSVGDYFRLLSGEK